MRKEVYTCDHCGKEIDSMNDYTEMEINNFDFFAEVDLCKKCYQEVSDIVKKFVNK